MKEWNTRVLCDVTETSRDGDQNPAPPLRAPGVLPAHICPVGQRTPLCFGRGSAEPLGSPTSYLRLSGPHILQAAAPGAPSGHHLSPSGLFVNSQRKPHSPCARERCLRSPRARPPGVHRSPAPGHVNARAGQRSARLRAPPPRSCAAGTGPRPEPGSPRRAPFPPRCPGNRGEWRTLSAGVAVGFRFYVRSSRGLGVLSSLIELFVLLFSPSR